jgi:hypothetical protein
MVVHKVSFALSLTAPYQKLKNSGIFLQPLNTTSCALVNEFQYSDLMRERKIKTQKV